MSETTISEAANPWRSVLTLNSNRTLRSGSTGELNAAIRRGADLRILTEFRHNEHIDPNSTEVDSWIHKTVHKLARGNAAKLLGLPD